MDNAQQKKVVIAGGTGMVGTAMSRLLAEKGYMPHWLTRSPSANDEFPSHFWDPAKGHLDPDLLKGAGAVINLSGAGIADKRWTDERKELLHDSRIGTNSLLVKTIAGLSNKPECFISASAIGYYGDRGEETMVETAAPADDFVGRLVVDWEKSAQHPNLEQVRQISFRIGLVLDRRGGFLENFEKPMKMGVAPYFGDGSQVLSWVHITDVCGAFEHGISSPDMDGAYNLTAPNPVDIKTFVSTLQKHIKNFSLKIPVPGAFIKIGFGELSEAILASTKVSSKKLSLAGYNWKFERLDQALSDLYS